MCFFVSSRVDLGSLLAWIYHATKENNYAKNANDVL